MSKNVGIWIRVSTEDQAKGESAEHHEERARMYAKAKGWNVIDVYHLEAVSGKAVMHHPEAKRMMQDVKNGTIQGLIFSKLARLARNTKELLDFADYFKEQKADLISLQESIDTSTPAGRLFYTLIAAMAQWEREEISDRVKASVKIRAQMGKSLGGEAPYGYKWVDKQLEIEETEAPIRKLMYELFLKHKRIRRVAQEINDLGYRTRKGTKFSDVSIGRFLRDSISKGLRRVNYRESTPDGKIIFKPEEEWIFQNVPAIVSEELWNSCNVILKDMEMKSKKTRRKGNHLFAGIAECHCGTRMYIKDKSMSYRCRSCGNKIRSEDLEEIFHQEIKSFVFSKEDIQSYLSGEQQKIEEKEKLQEATKKKIDALSLKISNILDLYHEGKILKDAFSKYHDPVYQEVKQLESTIIKIQSEIDVLKVQSLSNDQIIFDAQELQNHWNSFKEEDKRTIIESITKSIIIGEQEIKINLLYLPTMVSEENTSSPVRLSSSAPDRTAAAPLFFKK